MTLRTHHWLGAFFVSCFIHTAFAYLIFYAAPPVEGAQAKGANGLEISIQMVAAAIGAEAQQEVIKEPEPQLQPEPIEQTETPKEPEELSEEALETTIQAKPKKQVAQTHPPLVKPKPPQIKPTPVAKPLVKPIRQPPKEQIKPARQKITALNSQGAAANAAQANRADRANQSGGGQIVGQVVPSYQTTLGRWLAQYKTYPKKARRRKEEGTVHLRFTLNQEGYVTDFQIIRSAGHKSLDQETIKMLKRAQPLPKIPHELGVSAMTLTIPVQFALR